MTRITNKNQNPSPLVWEKNLYSLAWYLEGDYQEELKLDSPLSSNLSCLDLSLDGGFSKRLYMLMATEQTSKLAFATQLAEAFAKQDFGVLFITPEKNLSILPSFILSRQTLLHGIPNEKPIEEIIPFPSKVWGELSDTVREQVKLLTKNMGVIDSVNVKIAFLKARIIALQSKHEKFVCFVDGSHVNENQLIGYLHEYRQLAEELDIPIIIYSKVPVEDGESLSCMGGLMDRVSPYVDYSLLLKHKTVNGDLTSIFKGKESFDWLLYECYVMPSYLAPESRKCYLTFYSKFGLFSEA